MTDHPHALQANPIDEHSSLEYITKVGAEYYFEELEEKLEKSDPGKFLVLEVKSKEYFIDEDLLEAIEKAEQKFPHKLFFIVQIGTLQPPTNLAQGTEHAG